MDNLTIELGNLLRKECENIIDQIAVSNYLDKDELYDHYLKPNKYFNEKINETIIEKKKKPNKRILPENEQCLGRKMDFTQCTRKRKDHSKFCGSHKKNLPNGQVGDDGSCFNRVKKKRGRKRKDCLKNISDDEFATTKIHINNELYLIDNKNILYSFKENPETNESFPIIVGRFDKVNNKISCLE